MMTGLRSDFLSVRRGSKIWKWSDRFYTHEHIWFTIIQTVRVCLFCLCCESMSHSCLQSSVNWSEIRGNRERRLVNARPESIWGGFDWILHRQWPDPPGFLCSSYLTCLPLNIKQAFCCRCCSFKSGADVA